MTKRIVLLTMVLAVAFAGVLGVLAVPQPAKAAVMPWAWEWQGAKFEDYDPYYGDYVVAYVEGSTATLEVDFKNEDRPLRPSGDATIKSATLWMGWGQEVAATGLPAVIPRYESRKIQFQFTVPSTGVVSNAFTYDYKITIEYQTEGPRIPHQRCFVSSERVGVTDGATRDFRLRNRPVVPDSQTLYLVNDAENTITPVPAADYTIDCYTGEITFRTAPAAGNELYASYTYADPLGKGDGFNKVFKIGSIVPPPPEYTNPIVAAGSEKVLVWNEVTETFTPKTRGTDYTIDNETAKIVFNTAPASYEAIFAAYEVWESSSWFGTFGGSNFVILSADQAAAWDLGYRYEMLEEWWDYWWYYDTCVEAWDLYAQAQMAAESAMDAYERGDFAKARADMQTAVDKIQQSINAGKEYAKGWEDREIAYSEAELADMEAQAALTQAEAAKVSAEAARTSALVDAEKAKLEAEARKLRAAAERHNTYGVFLVLIGVAGLIVSIGGVIWAYSRLVAARGPKQM